MKKQIEQKNAEKLAIEQEKQLVREQAAHEKHLRILEKAREQELNRKAIAEREAAKAEERRLVAE